MEKKIASGQNRSLMRNYLVSKEGPGPAPYLAIFFVPCLAGTVQRMIFDRRSHPEVVLTKGHDNLFPSGNLNGKRLFSGVEIFVDFPDLTDSSIFSRFIFPRNFAILPLLIRSFPGSVWLPRVGVSPDPRLVACSLCVFFHSYMIYRPCERLVWWFLGCSQFNDGAKMVK